MRRGPQWSTVRSPSVLQAFPVCNIMEFLIISKCPPALGHFKIIPTMLNTYSIRRSGLPNKCIAPALPAASVRRTPWVLGPSVPAESCGPARQSSQDTASTALLGSGGGQPAGTAASPSIPGFVLGCGLSSSPHPAIRCVTLTRRIPRAAPRSHPRRYAPATARPARGYAHAPPRRTWMHQ